MSVMPVSKIHGNEPALKEPRFNVWSSLTGLFGLLPASHSASPPGTWTEFSALPNLLPYFFSETCLFCTPFGRPEIGFGYHAQLSSEPVPGFVFRREPQRCERKCMVPEIEP